MLLIVVSCATSRVTEKGPSAEKKEKAKVEKKFKTVEKAEKIEIKYPVTEDIKNSGDYKKFEELIELLRKDPTLADAHYDIGVIYSRHKEFSLAAKAYEEALKIRPDYVEAAVNLADAYKELGRYGAAEAIIKRVLRENPDDIRLLNALAIIYREKGKLDESLDLSLKVLKKDQKYLPARINIGLIYLLKKKYAMAYYVFDTSKDIDPNNPAIHEYKGYTLYFLGDLKGAEEEFKKALKLNPGKPELYVNLAIIRMKQEKWNEAEKFLKKALKIKPLMGEAHLDLGVVYLKLGKLKEAYRELKKAIKYGADKAAAYYNLAIVASLYRRKPDVAAKKAVEYLQLYLKYAVNISPDERKEVEDLIKDIKEIGVEVVYLYKPKFSQLPPYARPKEEGAPQLASGYGSESTSPAYSGSTTYATSTTQYTSSTTQPPSPATTAVSSYGKPVTSQASVSEGGGRPVTSTAEKYPEVATASSLNKKSSSQRENYPSEITGKAPRRFPETQTAPSTSPLPVTSEGGKVKPPESMQNSQPSIPKSVTSSVERETTAYPQEVSPVGEAPSVEEITPAEESPESVEEAPEVTSPVEPEEPEEISPEEP